MPLPPGKIPLTADDVAALKRATEKIDAAIEKRRTQDLFFYSRAEAPEGADEAFELGVVAYPVMRELVAIYREKGWHVYPDHGAGVLKLVDPS